MSIRFIDQDGKDIAVVIKQNGGSPGWVTPNKRTRFNVTFNAFAIRMTELKIDKSADDWMVNDIAVHGKSQIEKPWQGKADSPELDGIPGAVFAGFMSTGDLGFNTAQKGMTITIDVSYLGANPEGQPFSMIVNCKAAH